MSSDSPLHILHLTLGADAGGLSRYVCDLASAMHERGHRTTVAGDDGAWRGVFDESPLDYIEIPLKGGPLAFRRSLKTLDAWADLSSVDVIHTHYRRATLLGRRLQRSSRFRSRPPIVHTLHLSHLSLRWPRNWLSDFGDATIVASRQAERWLVDDAGVDAGRITFIPHGVETPNFPVADDDARREARRDLDITDDRTVGLFVGRLDDPKNEHWLLDLAAAAREQLPKLLIILVGEGPHEADVRGRVERERLGDRVRVVGRQEPLRYYQAADLLFLPSAREGFSLVCAEAMSVGVPTLRTRTSGYEELVIENQTGRSVPIDRDAFLEAAMSMLQDRDRLRQMGRQAAHLVRKNFTFQRQVDETIALYRSLLLDMSPSPTKAEG